MFSASAELVSDVLSDMFKLQHKAECRLLSPKEPCNLLSTFVDADVGWASVDIDGTHSYDAAEESPIETLRYARDVLSGSEANTHVEWWVEYGCALLCVRGAKGAAEDTRSYSLVGLDGWTAKTHSYPSGNGCTQRDGTSICTDSAILYVGSVSEESHSEFMELIHKVFKTASTRNGTARSAASNQNTHHPPIYMCSETLMGCSALLFSRGEIPHQCPLRAGWQPSLVSLVLTCAQY